MKTLNLILVLILVAFVSVEAQESKAGLTDEEILKLYDDLRVADVSDGMDVAGLRDAGLLDQRIEALWKDYENFDHWFCGIALTARYVPTNKVVKNPMDREEYSKWESNWYNNLSSEAWVSLIKPGTVVVLDVQGDGDTGTVGSYNSLAWKQKGSVGIVSNGGVRDTDEVIKERIPVYMDMNHRGRGIRPGRNELESYDKPVTIGGVLIRPGDVIVADGDGVICVPREYALQVAEVAHDILKKDKAGRRQLYQDMGIEPDQTVKP